MAEMQEIINALREVFTPMAEALTPDVEPATVYLIHETDDNS